MNNSHKAQVPFGYQFFEDLDQRPELEAPRADGQQDLLSAEDSELLASFFNMADNSSIDPNLFGGAEGDQGSSNQNAFGNELAGNFDFQSGGPQSSTSQAMESSDVGSGQHMPTHGVGPHTQPFMRSQAGGDAAQIANVAQNLIKMGQSSPSASSRYNQAASQGQYPPIAQIQSNLPYSNGQQTRNSYTNAGPSSQANSFASARGGYKKPDTLDFGSDQKFRRTTYQAVEDAIDQNQRQQLLSAIAAETYTGDRQMSHNQYPEDMSPRPGPSGDQQGSAPYDDADPSSRPSKRVRRMAELDSGDELPDLRRRSTTTASGKKGKQPATPKPSKRKSSAGTANTAEPPSPGSSTGGRSKRTNLTDDQKRANHINSEQNRRNDIKTNFGRMCAMIPARRDTKMTKSKSNEAAVAFMNLLRDKNAAFAEFRAALEREEDEAQQGQGQGGGELPDRSEQHDQHDQEGRTEKG